MKILESIDFKEEEQNKVLSFNEYLEIFEKKPKKECRPTFQYLYDMFHYFGVEDNGGFKLFKENHDDAPAIRGQLKVQQSLMSNLHTFQEEGFNNKFLLLVGPNGSSKSSIVKKIMKGAELYSENEEGFLYTFSWIFPIDSYVKGSLGLASEKSSKHLTSYAHLDERDIVAIINSEMKDHPFLLIPRNKRQELLRTIYKDDIEGFESIKRSYLYLGDVDKRNRMIFDALLKSYKGKFEDVYRHIRVERFVLSRRYSVGAVTIEPQLHVDARMQQITMDKRLASLPPSLQSLNLFSVQGETVLANRGILEFSDLLKRPLDAFKYLLTTMETRSINLQGILTELDIFFIGSSNEIHLNAFRQHPDFNSFRGRFNFIRVPYLLNYLEEEKIYEEQIEGLVGKTVFEPSSLRAISLFAVMSRLRGVQGTHYADKKLVSILTSLNPLEKTLFLGDGSMPEKLDSEAKQTLKHSIEDVKDEFINDPLYEGKFGLSPREVKKIIYSLGAKNKIVTVVSVVKYLEKLIQLKSDFEFLNITPHGDYHNPARSISLIKEYSLGIFDSKLRESLGLVDDRSYEGHISRYISSINSLIKGEKIKNTVTGTFEDVDQFFIREFEKGINLSEGADNFRKHLISTLGAYSLDNPGVKILYLEVFPELAQRLQASFREEQRDIIDTISRNIVFYESELLKDEGDDSFSSPLTEDNRNLVKEVLSNLMKKFNYTHQGALELLKYLINEKY